MAAIYKNLARIILMGHALLAASGCVGRDLYDETVANLQTERAHGSQQAQELAAMKGDVERLNAEVNRLGQELRARDASLGDAALTHANDLKRIDDLVALNSELSGRLRGIGQNVETLTGEKGALAAALADTRARLEELRKLESAAEARAASFRNLVERFRSLVDAGVLKVVLRDGRMLLELANDILFDSGKAELRDVGRKTLTEVAHVLKGMPDRRFQVSGHTDNVQIATTRFPSNWELSTARAVAVVKLLVDAGMSPRTLSAAGYGEFAPAASNDSPDGRAKNRRIEIALVPNLAELANVSNLGKPSAPPQSAGGPTPR
jgi:chemotaxis protein MotB